MTVRRIGCRRSFVRLFTLVALASAAPVVEAQTPGTLDSSFLNDGSVGAADIADYPSALPIAAADAAGRLVIGEAASASDGAMVLRRISDNGAQLIRHIAVFSGATHRAWAITRLANGGFVGVGMANASGNRYLFVTRLSSDLAVDTTFGSGGFVTRYWGGISIRNADVAVAADGSIYVAGGTTSSAGGNASFLIRWSSTGVRTYEFREMEYGNDESIARVLATTDGKILLAGWTRSSTPVWSSSEPVTATWFVQRRIAASGLIDGSFGSGGKAVVSWPVLPVTNLVFFLPEALQNQLGGATRDGAGRIYLAGQVTTTLGLLPFVVRLTVNGAVDSTFGSSGKLLVLLGPGARPSGAVDVAVVAPAQLSPALLLWGFHFPEGTNRASAVIEARTLDGAFYPGFGTDTAWSRTPLVATTLGAPGELYRLQSGRLALSPAASKVYAAVRFWDDNDDYAGPSGIAPPLSFGLRFWTPH